MFQETSEGQTNYCPLCEGYARKLEEAEAQLEKVKKWAEKRISEEENKNYSLSQEILKQDRQLEKLNICKIK